MEIKQYKTRLEELDEMTVEMCSDMKIYEAVCKWAGDSSCGFAGVMKVINDRIRLEIEKALLERSAK